MRTLFVPFRVDLATGNNIIYILENDKMLVSILDARWFHKKKNMKEISRNMTLCWLALHYNLHCYRYYQVGRDVTAANVCLITIHSTRLSLFHYCFCFLFFFLLLLHTFSAFCQWFSREMLGVVCWNKRTTKHDEYAFVRYFVCMSKAAVNV